MGAIPIAIVGPGKIALDRHFPAIAGGSRFELAAVVSRRGIGHAGVPVFGSAEALYRERPDIGAVAFCTPPDGRHAAVREALLAGRDVLMEKPPTTTLAALHELEALAQDRGRVLFATWHCQFNTAVERARDLLAAENLRQARVTWRESVWRWHPGQEWIWQPGGFGVFDPGINALSILTAILPGPVVVARAHLEVPANRQTPIAAALTLRSAAGAEIQIEFDWRERHDERWNIAITTGTGRELLIGRGGGDLSVDGLVEFTGPKTEYEAIYRRFAQLLDARRSEIDAGPLRLAADAFLLASRETVAPFHW